MTKIELIQKLNCDPKTFDDRSVSFIYNGVIKSEHCLPMYPCPDKMLDFIELCSRNINKLTEKQFVYIMRYSTLHSISMLCNLIYLISKHHYNSHLSEWIQEYCLGSTRTLFGSIWYLIFTMFRSEIISSNGSNSYIRRKKMYDSLYASTESIVTVNILNNYEKLDNLIKEY